MKVLINAISIETGGGLAVLIRLLSAMSNEETGAIWYVAADSKILSQLPKSDKIVGVPYSWVKKSPLHHFYWYKVELPRLLRKVNADICFSQTNFLPRSKLSCPTLLLVQHAGYFSERFHQLFLYWNRKYINTFIWKQKNKWIRQSINDATIVTVQTNALATIISNELKIQKEKIVVIPHGPGILKNFVSQPKPFPTDDVIRIGYITKLGVQKNFDVAIKAVSLLRDKGLRVKLVLTLDERDFSMSRMLAHIQSQILQYEVADMIENHGEVSSIDEIKKLYDSLHLFIFPSLCESFGFTLVEAMTMGLPVVIADTESNCEVAGVAGESVPAENAEILADKIYQIINNKALYISASEKSIGRSQDFSWDKTGKDMIKIMRQMVKNIE